MGQNGPVRYSTGKVIARSALAFFSLLSIGSALQAQVSAYASSSYGYDQNPLSNYEKAGDQLSQNSLLLNYSHELANSSYELSYSGALALFNQFHERNYYEHSASGKYSIRLTSGVEPQSALDDSSEEDDDQSDDANSPLDSTNIAAESDSSLSSLADGAWDDDSSDSFIDLGFAASARHDKDAFAEFDNIGADAFVAYRLASENYFARLTNSIGGRSYQNVTELSNVTDIFSVEYAPNKRTPVRYGFLFSAGMKYYTDPQYDTTTFETKRTGALVQKGKGKSGTGNQQLKKGILIQSASNHTSQITLGVYAGKTWGATGVDSRILIRRNPTSNSRYLAQRSTSSSLTTDIYNDSFSYQGAEWDVQCAHEFPHSFHLVLSAELHQKNFNVPALSIDGIENANKRKDVRSGLSLAVSRNFTLSDAFTLDATLTFDSVRNRSNDEYNDFSGKSVSFAIGVGI